MIAILLLLLLSTSLGFLVENANLALADARLPLPVSGGAGGHAPTGSLSPVPPSATALSGRSATVPPIHLGSFSVPGPKSSAWGTDARPPGWMLPMRSVVSAGAGGPNPPPLGPNASNGSSRCYGIATYLGQSVNPPSCAAHDEVLLNFYSAQPGSGGNVTWNFTLPVDRSATQNQSDLYGAAWVGIVLADPQAWLGQCYLEIQFYPDSSWYYPSAANHSTTLPGIWTAAAVGWQIDPTTGAEDSCFYAPLSLEGSASPTYLNMTQGDRIELTLTGWSGDPAGETVSVVDLSSGASSTVFATTTLGSYPLDPAYSTNSFANALQWSPGGQYPISFGFEVGRGANPSIPSNNSFAGCSPSPAHSGAFSPCPSYDPSSWVNDTLVPWQISAPVFFDASVRSTSNEVAFSDTVGGGNVVSATSGGSCTDRLGSSGCSYPWYSYSCSAGGFEFGAADWNGFSEDFGQYNQFAGLPRYDSAGFGFYPPTSFSVPACGAMTSNLTVGVSGTAGTLRFLSGTYSGSATVAGLSAGTYQIVAQPGTASVFTGWLVSGLVTVAASTSPWTSITISGSGAVTATFAATGPSTLVTFGQSPSGGVVIDPGATWARTPLGTVLNGGTLALAPGIYSIQAYPGPGHNFTQWALGSTGVELASSSLPFTWLIVDGSSSAASVVTSSVASNAESTVFFGPSGQGRVVFGGTSVGPGGLGFVTLPVGTHPISAIPAPGYLFAGWVFSPSAIVTDFSDRSNATLEGGPAIIAAAFVATPVPVMFTSAPTNGGDIDVNGVVPLASGSLLSLTPGYYLLYSAPAAGYAFQSWGASPARNAIILSPLAASTLVQIVGPATVSVSYAIQPTGPLTFTVSPLVSAILFDGFAIEYSGSTNTSVVPGQPYLIYAPNVPGYAFVGWSTRSTSVGCATCQETTVVTTLKAPPPAITATYSLLMSPLTFVGTDPSADSASVGLQTLPSGASEQLSQGSYALNTTSTPFLEWASTSNISIANRSAASTSISDVGSGTIYLTGSAIPYVPPFTIGAPLASPTALDVGGSISLSVLVTGPGPFSYVWQGLPGCPSQNSPSFTCLTAQSGHFAVSVMVNDSAGQREISPVVYVDVNPLPRVASFVVSRSPDDVGLGVTFTVTPAQGLPAYSYAYAGLPAGCATVNAPSLSCTPSAVGTFNVTVTVTDSQGARSQGSVAFTVNSRPAVSAFTASPAVTDVGSSVTLQTTTSGGTGPFTYQYSSLPAGCTSANAATLSCQPTSAGSDRTQVTATDSQGVAAFSNVSFTINPLPTAGSATAQPAIITEGVTTTLGFTVNGGTAPFTYAYSALPAGCSTVSAASLSCSPTAWGQFLVHVVATDAAGASADSSIALTVNAPPAIEGVSLNSSPVVLGNAVAISVLSSGGTAPFQFVYTGLPAGCATQNSNSLTCAPSVVGFANVTVTLTDIFGKTATATFLVRTVNPPSTTPPPPPPPTPSSSTTTGLLGLPGTWGYLVLGLIGLCLALAAMIALLVSRNRKRPVTPSQPFAGTMSPVVAAIPAANAPAVPAPVVPPWVEGPNDTEAPTSAAAPWVERPSDSSTDLPTAGEPIKSVPSN